MNVRSMVVVAVVALTGAACGDDDADAALTLSVDPSTISIAAGETQTVAVAIERPSGVASEVQLAIVDNPSGLTVTVDPQAATDTATMTITTNVNTAGTTSTITLLASTESLAATARVEVTVGEASAVTVQGHLVNSVGGAADTPTSVAVYSHGATLPLTPSLGTDGTFTANGVTPPYDVHLVAADGLEVLYLGLTNVAPYIVTDPGLPSQSSGVVVNGSIQGTAPAESETYVAGVCPRALGSALATTSYSVALGGLASTGEACTASVLRLSFDAVTGNPTGYLAYDEKPFTASTDTATIVDFEPGAGPLASHNVTLSVEPSIEAEISSLWLSWFATGGLYGEAVPAQNFALVPGVFAVPSGAGSYAVMVSGGTYYAGWQQAVPVDATTEQLTIAHLPQLVFEDMTPGQPAVEAKVTPFSEASATYVYLLNLVERGALVVSAGEISGADMAARGVVLSDADHLRGYVYAFFSEPEVDGFVSHASLIGSLSTSSSVRVVTFGAD